MRVQSLLTKRARTTGHALVFVFLLVACAAGCTQYAVLRLGPGERAPELGFREIRQRAAEVLEVEGDGVRLRVYHAPDELDLARTALAEAEASARFAAEAVGASPKVTVDLYLYPWRDEEELPDYRVEGADYVSVIFYGDPGDLLASTAARRTLRAALVHKVAIRRLLSMPGLDPKRDRWLLEGLPEALVYRYTQDRDPEVWLEETAWNPPLPLVASMELQPWNQERLVRLLKAAEEGDERLAYYLGVQETQILAAAQGLVLRWLEAMEAQEPGAALPSRELVTLLRSHAQPVDWEATRQLSIRQTGRSPDELVRPSAEELLDWRSAAWADRHHPILNRRLMALRTLELVGLPEGVAMAPEDLDRILEHEEIDLPRKRYALWQAATGVVAELREPELARHAIERLAADGTEYRFSYRSLPVSEVR